MRLINRLKHRFPISMDQSQARLVQSQTLLDQGQREAHLGLVLSQTRLVLDQSQARPGLDQTQAHPGLNQSQIRLDQSLLVIVDHPIQDREVQDQKAQDRVGQAQDQRVQGKEVC